MRLRFVTLIALMAVVCAGIVKNGLLYQSFGDTSDDSWDKRFEVIRIELRFRVAFRLYFHSISSPFPAAIPELVYKLYSSLSCAVVFSPPT